MGLIHLGGLIGSPFLILTSHITRELRMQALFPLYDYSKLEKKLQLLKQEAKNELKRVRKEAKRMQKGKQERQLRKDSVNLKHRYALR